MSNPESSPVTPIEKTAESSFDALTPLRLLDQGIIPEEGRQTTELLDRGYVLLAFDFRGETGPFEITDSGRHVLDNAAAKEADKKAA